MARVFVVGSGCPAVLVVCVWHLMFVVRGQGRFSFWSSTIAHVRVQDVWTGLLCSRRLIHLPVNWKVKSGIRWPEPGSTRGGHLLATLDLQVTRRFTVGGWMQVFE